MNEQSKKFTEPVKTTFAPSGSPWLTRLKQHTESKVMIPAPAPAPKPTPKPKKQTKQPVKPAGKPIQPVEPKLSCANEKARIDPETLRVSDMPYPGRGGTPAAKFALKFAELGVNKRLVCKIQDTNGVRKAMEKWAERSMPGHFVRYITDCGDGMGGVWLLNAEK